MKRSSFVGLALCLLTACASNCTCQRPENVAAKRAMSEPPPADPLIERAKEKLDVDAMPDNDELARHIHMMPYKEMVARLGSFVLESDGQLVFSRSQFNIASSEKARVVQAESGDFSVHLEAGKDGTQEVAYINEILFLKNRNGAWRASRDPTGERHELVRDAAGVWRSFYKMYAHSLRFSSKGGDTVAGRSATRFAMMVPDESAKAKAAGENDPSAAPTAVTEDGAPDRSAATEKKRLNDRMQAWRTKAHPAGGTGDIWIDRETGVVLKVKFTGKLAVGDGPTPALLNVNIKMNISDVGHGRAIPAPKGAIDEIVRHKTPVNVREVFEKQGVVPPAPKDDTSANGKGAPSK